MGIQGLSSFIDNNPHLLKDLRLHDTRVIIDGKNLFHFLYFYFNINPQCGGDYDTFAQRVRYYFTTLIKCNVQSYVVFDGAYDASDMKLSTTIKRAFERLRIAESAVSGCQCNLIPIFAQRTFTCVLDELGIPHVTCDFEADREIAALANKWKCPVMSNDSDFYIYDVTGGFILFDYLNLESHVVKHSKSYDPKLNDQSSFDDSTASYNYLNAQVFHLDSVLKQYKFTDRKLMALFATLQGNDYVKYSELEDFFCKCQLPKQQSKKYKLSKRQSRMNSVLLWFERHQFTYEHALKCVLSNFDPSKRKHAQDLIEKSVNMYLDLNTNLDQYFENQDLMLSSNGLKTSVGNDLPCWMLEGIRSSAISTQCLNAMMLHRVFLKSQVECLASVSAHKASLPLRQMAYGLVFSLDVEAEQRDIEQQPGMKTTVIEYDREKKNLKKNEIESEFEFCNGKIIPNLNDIVSFTSQQKVHVVLQFLDVPEQLIKKLLALVPRELVFLCLVAVYWVKNADPLIQEVHLRALLICFLKMCILDRLDVAAEFDRLTNMNENDRRMAEQNIQKFCKSEYFSKSNRVDVDIIQGFAQYQSCLDSAVILHELCQTPLGRTNPAHVLNGSLMYNMCKELKRRKNPVAYIEELLVCNSSVQQFYTKLYDCLYEFIPSARFKTAHEKQNKKRGKCKKVGDNRTKVPRHAESTLRSGSESEDKKERDSVIVEAACAVENKFSCLLLE